LASAPNGVRRGGGPGLAQALQGRSDQCNAALAEELADGTSHVAQPAQLLRQPLQLRLLNRRETSEQEGQLAQADLGSYQERVDVGGEEAIDLIKQCFLSRTHN
jgi:hypothetical protein